MTYIDIERKDEVQLRFEPGTRVECWYRRDEHTEPTWALGEVVSHFYTQSSFPPGKCAPYQVRLDTSRKIFALKDHDSIIRRYSIDIDTPLSTAARMGDLKLTCELLKQGHCAQQRSGRTHRTPLLHAAREGHNHIVEILLMLRVPTEMVDNKGFTAVALAAEQGHLLVLQVLVDAGACVK